MNLGRLHQKIKEAVESDRWRIGDHADERLRQRGIARWHAVLGVSEGRLVRERLDASPNPVIEIEHVLPDGTTVKAVWGWIGASDSAKLVTIHFLDR